jgi:hypothetical protein
MSSKISRVPRLGAEEALTQIPFHCLQLSQYRQASCSLSLSLSAWENSRLFFRRQTKTKAEQDQESIHPSIHRQLFICPSLKLSCCFLEHTGEDFMDADVQGLRAPARTSNKEGRIVQQSVRTSTVLTLVTTIKKRRAGVRFWWGHGCLSNRLGKQESKSECVDDEGGI